MKTINFHDLQVKNFFSIGNEPVHIQFKAGLNIITGINLDKVDRQNGVGKSSIIDAIFFSLYGESLRKVDKLEQICNFKTKKPTEVNLKLSITENNATTQVEIIRSLKPSKVQININGVDKTLDSIANNNNLIVNLLQYDAETFKNCVSMSLNNTDPFMLKKKQQKREFIESIFSLKVFSDLLEVTKKKHSLANKECEMEATRFDEITRNIQTYQNQKKALELERLKRKKGIDDRVIECGLLLNQIKDANTILEKTDFEKIQSEIDTKSGSVKKAIVRYRFLIDDNKTKITEANTKIQVNNKNFLAYNIKSTRDELNASIKLLDDEINTLNTHINELSKVPYDTEHKVIEDTRKSIYDSIKATEEQIKSTSKEITEKITLQSIESKNLQAISKQLGECPTCKRPFETHDKDRLELEKIEIAKQINVYTSEISRLEEIVNSCKGVINTSNQQLSELSTKSQLLCESSGAITKHQNTIDSLKSKKVPYETALLNWEASQKLLEENAVLNTERGAEMQTLAANQTALSQLENVLAGIEAEQKALDKQIASIAENNTKIANLNNELKLLNENLENLNKSTEQFDTIINENVLRQLTTKKGIDNLKDKIQLFDQAKFVFSEEGVKSYLIKKTLDLFNNRLAYYIKQLDSKYMCFFNEYFEEEILNDAGNTFSYQNLSGAERKAIDFACLFTFMDIRRLQGDVSLNISFYDELLDSSLDSTGIEIVLNVLRERIERYNESMFIISHRKESAKFATGEVVFLEMRNDITRRIPYTSNL